MGWLGWSEQQTLYSDIQAIYVGIRGKFKLVLFEKGGDPWAKPQVVETRTVMNRLPDGRKQYLPLPKGYDPKKLKPLTVDAFDAMFDVKRPGKKSPGPIRARPT